MNKDAKFSDTTEAFLSLSEYLRKTVDWINVIPAEQAIAIKFDSLAIFPSHAKKIIEEKISQFRFSKTCVDKPLINIPVYYSEEFGLDIKEVAKKYSYSFQEIADLHSGNTYEVKMIGFTPGFAYLGNLSKKLFMPRLLKPRTNILPGSVGISGNRTGIYPLGGPGGWRIIGRTPKSLFDPNKNDPFKILFGHSKRARLIYNGKHVSLASTTNGKTNVSCLVLPKGRCNEFALSY